ncbi:hypothetical protein Plhal703r1_c12g0060531 [Plasmopara halstedii]
MLAVFVDSAKEISLSMRADSRGLDQVSFSLERILIDCIGLFGSEYGSKRTADTPTSQVLNTISTNFYLYVDW